MKHLILFVIVFVPSVLSAQSTNSNTSNANNNNVTDNDNIGEFGLLIEDSWAAPKLNTAVCEGVYSDPDNSRSLRIEIDTSTYTIIAFGTDIIFYAWWSDTANSDCTESVSQNGEKILGTVVLNDNPAHITVPNDLEKDGATPELSFKTIFDRVIEGSTKSCTDNVDKTITLCFGVDLTNAAGTGTPNDKIEPTDFYGWVRIKVDTWEPPAASISSVTSLDGRVRIDASVSEENSGAVKDILQWQVVRHLQPEDPNAQLQPCNSWEDSSHHVLDVTGATASFEVGSLENFSTYEFCAGAIDASGNEGLLSAPKVGTPEPEAGFLEAWPGHLETGHCRELGGLNWGTILLAGFGALLVFRRLKCN